MVYGVSEAACKSQVEYDRRASASKLRRDDATLSNSPHCPISLLYVSRSVFGVVLENRCASRHELKHRVSMDSSSVKKIDETEKENQAWTLVIFRTIKRICDICNLMKIYPNRSIRVGLLWSRHIRRRQCNYAHRSMFSRMFIKISGTFNTCLWHHLPAPTSHRKSSTMRSDSCHFIKQQLYERQWMLIRRTRHCTSSP